MHSRQKYDDHDKKGNGGGQPKKQGGGSRFI